MKPVAVLGIALLGVYATVWCARGGMSCLSTTGKPWLTALGVVLETLAVGLIVLTTWVVKRVAGSMK